MSDDFILQNFSSSPGIYMVLINFTDKRYIKHFLFFISDVEPVHFAKQMKSIFAFVAQHPFPMHSIFKSNKTIQYSLSTEGEWQEI